MSVDRVALLREELEDRPADPFNDLLDRFRDYLDARNRSDRTVKNYMRLIRRYVDHANDLEPFERRHVDSFLARLKREGSGGVNQRWAYYVIRTFFRAMEHSWPFEKSEVPKAEDNEEVPVLQEEDMAAMEGVARERRSTAPKLGLKYHALVRLERAVGIRRIEMQNANIGDYFPAQGSRPAYLRVTTAKGGKTVMRPLDPVTAKALEDWVKVLRRQRSRPDKEALFVKGVRGPRISLRGLNYIFASIRDEAGVSESGAGFHAMRRGRVTGLHEGGMSGPEITKEFGWKSPQTVNRYIRLSKRGVEDKLMEVHPLFKEDEETLEGPESAEEFDRVAAVVAETEAPTPSRYVRDPETGRIRRRDTNSE
jgi:site-specific recombinase XerD